MLVNFDGKNGAVVGVGVNVNEKLIPYDHKLSAISLADVAKGEVNRELVLASFCNELENVMQKPMEEVSFTKPIVLNPLIVLRCIFDSVSMTNMG